jgi:hypothetical protein
MGFELSSLQESDILAYIEPEVIWKIEVRVKCG